MRSGRSDRPEYAAVFNAQAAVADSLGGKFVVQHDQQCAGELANARLELLPRCDVQMIERLVE